MKNVKKQLSIVMVLTLVLSLGASAFAATVTIADDLDGHTFTAYQIFTGTQAADQDNELASVAWGSGIKSDSFVAALNALGDPFGSLTVENVKGVVEALSKVETGSEMAKSVAEAAADNITGEGTPISSETTELPNGYYLIKDTTAELNGNKAYNDVVLQVTENITIEYKTDVPTSDKKVQDKNDTTGETSGWQDSADWDIGDEVPFQLTGTLPSNYGDYDEYAITFHDEQSAGLSFNKDSVVVKVDGKVLNAESYSVETPGKEEGCTFEIVIPDMKKIQDAEGNPIATTAESSIEVTYNSTLTGDAVVIGRPGNPNTMYMEFSNNAHGDGTGTTPEKTVVVFTYQMNVEKVDGDQEPLEGAGFTLLKKVEGNTDTVTLGKAPNQVTYTGYVVVGDGEKTASQNAEGKYVVDYKGLDDGEYILVETTVPNGYNKAADLKFTVTATHDAASGKGDSLTGLTTDNEAIHVSGVDSATLSGQLDTQVVNESGVQLPETGGIGTTIFYIVGAVLVAGAVILLVTKKRVSGAEK